MRPCCWRRTVGLLDWIVCGGVIVRRWEQFTGRQAERIDAPEETTDAER